MDQKFQNKEVLKILLTVVFVFVMTVLQTTVIHGIEVFHVIPNLLMVTVVCYGLLHEDYSALAVGAACGLLLDLQGGRVVGMNALLCTLLAYLCIYLSGSLYNNNSLVALVFVFILSIFYELVIYIFYFGIWGQGAFSYALLHKILPVGVYNALVTLVIYPLTRKITVLK